MEFLRPWQRTIAAIAMAKVFVALGIYGASITVFGGTWSTRDIRFLACIVVFASIAVFLMTAGRRDLRAAVLGVSFALTAAVFSDTALNVDAARGASIPGWIEWLFALQADAFTGYFLW